MANPFEFVPRETAGGTIWVHPTALVHPEATIGDDTRLHPFSQVREGSVIGRNCHVGAYAEVEGATLGDGAAVWSGSKIRPGASLGNGSSMGHGSIANTHVHIGSGVRIQNHVSIPEGVTVRDWSFIGPGAKFPNDRHPRAFGPWEIGQTIIGFGASIGANATVVCGTENKPTHVGEFSTLAAGSVATKSLIPFGLYVGNKQIGWVNPFGETVSRNPNEIPPSEAFLEGLEAGLRQDKRITEQAAILITSQAEAALGLI